MRRQNITMSVVIFIWMLGVRVIYSQQSTPPDHPPMNPRLMEYLRNIAPQPQISFPLYGDGAIPNSKRTPNEEVLRPMGQMANVSRPTLEVFLPAKVKENGASILVFPGGGYVGLTWNLEGPAIGQFFQDHGIAAFVVKYRLPSDATMEDKTIGPLQDAQQAMIVVPSGRRSGI